jgi:hypothetical protein
MGKRFDSQQDGRPPLVKGPICGQGTSFYQFYLGVTKMKSETLEMDGRFGEEYQGKYVFKEITWAKRSRIIQKYTKYNRLSGEVESTDFIAIQAETILASMHGQPETHPITLETLLSEESGIPIGLGELFSQVTNRLNTIGAEESHFLSEPSGDKNHTLPLQTSDSTKNSDGPQTSSLGSQPKPSSSVSSSLGS